MRACLSFLARYALAIGLLYGVWPWLAPAYLCLVAPAVNAVLAGLGLPVLLELRGSAALLSYATATGWLRLQAHGYDVVYLNLLVSLALVAAWPCRSLRWRLRWAAAVVAGLWVTHVGTFVASGHLAIWDYLDALPPGLDRDQLVAQIAPLLPQSRALWLSRVVAQWDMWGRYAVVAGAWVGAVRLPGAWPPPLEEAAPVRPVPASRSPARAGSSRSRWAVARACLPTARPVGWPAWARYGAMGAFLVFLLGSLASCEGPPAAPLIPPEADAGSDQRVQVGQSVLLDGSRSQDTDDGALTFAWVQVEGPVVGIQGANSPRAAVMPAEPGVYLFRLTVTSTQGVSATDEVHLLVLQAESGGEDAEKPGNNTSPHAHAGRDQQVAPGQSVALDGGASFDAESSDLQYAWVQVGGPATVGIVAADSPWATVVPVAEGEYLFRLTVTDGQGASGVDEVRIVVAALERDATLRITASPVGPSVTRAEYLVAAARQDSLRGELVVTEDRVARKTLLGVPAGGERLVEVLGYDASGRLVTFGSTMIEVPEGGVVDVTIELRGLLPGAGGIVVEAVFPDSGG